MNIEVRKKIMVFFILEARKYLQVLENGLSFIADPCAEQELIENMYRAAHSMKGGAAMLGLTSIQRISLDMETSLKVLNEYGIPGDETLEALLRQCIYVVTHLVDELDSPQGLKTGEGNAALLELKPVLQRLELHTKVLLGEISEEEKESQIAKEAVCSMLILSQQQANLSGEAVSMPITVNSEPSLPTGIAASAPLSEKSKHLQPINIIPQTLTSPDQRSTKGQPVDYLSKQKFPPRKNLNQLKNSPRPSNQPLTLKESVQPPGQIGQHEVLGSSIRRPKWNFLRALIRLFKKIMKLAKCLLNKD